MAIVSRTTNTKQRQKDFKEYQLEKYIQVFELIPSEGTKEFDKVLQQLGLKPEECVVIGDRIKSEIVEGNKIGLTTIWLKQGLFTNELPENSIEEPDHIIMSLKEINPLMDSLIK